MPEKEALEKYLGGTVRVVVGDITAQDVDAIVNAANSTLLGGGGVDGAIHRKGGAAILQECREIRRTGYPEGLPTGEVVITTGGNLPARFVIHTVGPICRSSSTPDAQGLASCYRKALELAEEKGLRSIAFPAISTGAYGYPREEAAEVASRAIEEGLRAAEGIAEVRLVFFDAADAGVFVKHQKFSA
jgi:O-acetyl-ADP-ribose deacetylase (regulator of RNase III)